VTAFFGAPNPVPVPRNPPRLAAGAPLEEGTVGFDPNANGAGVGAVAAGSDGVEEFVENENPVKALGGSGLDGFWGSTFFIPKESVVVDTAATGRGAIVLDVAWFKGTSGFVF
jgi:hypothetical protein